MNDVETCLTDDLELNKLDDDWSIHDEDENEDDDQLIMLESSLDEWTKINFSNIIKARKKIGNNKDSFDRDIKMWQNFISQLETYNKSIYMSEINDMSFDIPDNATEFKELQGVYSRLVRYRDRITRMKSVVNSQHEMFSKAYKSLRLVAMSLFREGTAKDKEANAEYVVQPFYIGTLESKNLLDLMIDVLATIDFASTNLSRIMKEKEIQSRTSYGHTIEGDAHNHDVEVQKPTNGFDTSEIRTRKKIKYD